MTTRPYELLARFGTNGTIAGVSVRTITTVDGREFEGSPTPLSGATDPAFVAFAEQFAAAAMAENETLKTTNATLTTDLATRTSERDALQTQLTTTTDQLNLANNTLETANALVATLQSRVTELEQYRPYNPRILAGEAFYNRVSKEDMVTLLASDNPQLVIVGKTIEAYRANRWPVILDSTDFQQLVGYVLQSGVFDEEEVVAIMRDATREEAYNAE